MDTGSSQFGQSPPDTHSHCGGGAINAPLLSEIPIRAGRAFVDGVGPQLTSRRHRIGGSGGWLVGSGPSSLAAVAAAETLPADWLERCCADRTRQVTLRARLDGTSIRSYRRAVVA